MNNAGVTSRLLLALVLLVLAACSGGERPTPVVLPFAEEDLPAEKAFLERIDRSRGVRDFFPLIQDPVLVPAEQAPRMDPDELILGLDLGAVQVAYPTRLLNFHEIVEHELEGFELLVCW